MSKNEIQIDAAQLKGLFSRIDEAARKFPELRRETFEKVARELSTLVDRNIRTVSPPIAGDTVQGWQDRGRVGTRGGYAAIAPKRETFKQQGREKYAVGYLTNALTHGTTHVRTPTGTDPGYVRRVRYGQIRRRPFYTNAARELDREKAQLAEELARKIADILEGGGG